MFGALIGGLVGGANLSTTVEFIINEAKDITFNPLIALPVGIMVGIFSTGNIKNGEHILCSPFLCIY